MTNAGSSSERPQPSSPPADAGAKPETFIDWGPALPESYGLPRILALVRDPQCFFVCWEEGDALCARDLGAGTRQEHPVGRIGSWYFEGLPEHEYEVDLLRNGAVVAVSKRFRLPRLEAAVAVDPDWTPTTSQDQNLRDLRSTLAPIIEEIEGQGRSAGWRRRVAGLPVSRPSRSR